MIYGIYSDMPAFKNLQFWSGLNIILAEKSPGATERQTRNGAGKSIFTELVHFLLGANLDKSSPFVAKVLSNHVFGMEFDLGQTKTQAERSGKASSKVRIKAADTYNWPLKTSNYDLFGTLELSNSQWRILLGTFIFDLTESNEEVQGAKFGPTFRSLFSYFVRRQSAGGFLSPIKQTTYQQIWDQQVSISYLLGLDWTIPQQWQLVREKERSLHESVIANRRSYLESENAAATQRMKVRDARMSTINDRLAKIMATLQSHGALDQFVKLQSELAEQEARTESIRQRFAAAEQLEGQKSELDFERNQLELRLRRDYHEQEELLRNAILAFGKISSDLYEDAGNFTIDATSNGPRFDVTIRGEKSKGISNMQIFCFDMMLMRLCAERHIGPGFLVHDSHIFDGVDERQVAKALQIGERTARELNFQYIVTMNSDAVPKEFPDDFDPDRYILPVRLTDATEEGGLFGIRF